MKILQSKFGRNHASVNYRKKFYGKIPSVESKQRNPDLSRVCFVIFY